MNNCEVAGTGLRLAMAGCHAYLHIHCRDRFSNPTERRDYPMDFGMIIIPEELYIADSMQKAAMEQQQLEESRQQEKKQGKGRMSKEVVVEKQRTYSDDEIYGLSSSRAKRRMTEAQEAEAKAKAEAKAAKKAAAGAPSAEAFVPLWKRGASAGAPAPAASAPSAAPPKPNRRVSKDAPAPAPAPAKKAPAGKPAASPPPSPPPFESWPPSPPGGSPPPSPPPSPPAMAPAAAPAGAAAKKQMKGADRRASLLAEKTAKEKKAQEEAAEAQRLEDEKAEQEKEKQRVMRTAMAAKTATVKSQDFEGCWRSGGEYEIRYIMKKAGKFLLHVWCDLEGKAFVSASREVRSSSKSAPRRPRALAQRSRVRLSGHTSLASGLCYGRSCGMCLATRRPRPMSASRSANRIRSPTASWRSSCRSTLSRRRLAACLCARQKRRPRRPNATRARQSMN